MAILDTYDYNPDDVNWIPAYDSNTGIPTFEQQPATIPVPATGDSGYSYGSDVARVLTEGLRVFGATKQTQYQFESKNPYTLGRGGLAQQGQPLPGPINANGSINASWLIVGALAVAGYLLLAK